MSPDLVSCLKDFFHSYLRKQRALSPHTIKSYRDTFKLLVQFAGFKRPSVSLNLTDLDVKLTLAFLQHLESPEQGRHNSARTRNQRLAAIHCFFKYTRLQHPSIESQAKRILAIPLKRAPAKQPHSLNRQELEAVLAQPSTTPDGFRDLCVLTFLYNTGARAQEVADARLSWFDFPNQMVTLIGKGNKERATPLWPSAIRLLETYRDTYRRKPDKLAADHFFINQRGGPFTRFGVRAIAKKYFQQAARSCPSLTKKRLSTHSFRHTTAVHLLESRVDPNVIKAWLGHANLSSTSHYLDTDLNHKRRILDQFAPPHYVTSSLEPKKNDPPDKILNWLDGL